jgi:indole-3-glycerol phosphate synthase
MATASRERARAARGRVSEGALLAQARALPSPPALELGGFDVIAELKLRSPSAGGLATTGFDRKSQIEAYARGGAAAVSVLTEPDEFHGSLEHLREAAKLLGPFGRPAMRKDFLTDPYQIVEARAVGAGGVLLIVTMLEDAELETMLATARELGLFVLLEAFDAADLERIGALATGFADASLLAGLNSRNLKTLAVDFERFAELAPRLPRALPTVAESGIGGPRDIERVAALGYRLALVGSALMHEGAPAQAVEAFVTAGRAAARRATTGGA